LNGKGSHYIINNNKNENNKKRKKKMKLRSAKYVKFNLQVLINTAINYNLRGCVTLTACSPIITKYSFWIWINIHDIFYEQGHSDH